MDGKENKIMRGKGRKKKKINRVPTITRAIPRKAGQGRT
jgi:hypothetical protein